MMNNRNCYSTRVSEMAIALLLFAGLFDLQPFAPRMAKGGDRRETEQIAPGLVTAIREADVRSVKKLIEDGANVNGRDGEGNPRRLNASRSCSRRVPTSMRQTRRASGR
jgi:hypothetical protein